MIIATTLKVKLEYRQSLHHHPRPPKRRCLGATQPTTATTAPVPTPQPGSRNQHDSQETTGNIRPRTHPISQHTTPDVFQLYYQHRHAVDSSTEDPANGAQSSTEDSIHHHCKYPEDSYLDRISKIQSGLVRRSYDLDPEH
jgi:hypothetical protein